MVGARRTDREVEGDRKGGDGKMEGGGDERAESSQPLDDPKVNEIRNASISQPHSNRERFQREGAIDEKETVHFPYRHRAGLSPVGHRNRSRPYL